MWIGTVFLTTFLTTFVPGSAVDLWGYLGGFVAGACVTGFFYYEIVKFQSMDVGKFVFPAIYVILAFIAGVCIILMNTKKCYDNLCHEGLDWKK